MPRKPKEDPRLVNAAKALGIKVETAKRIVRTGNGPVFSRMVLARALDLTDDELIYGTREAAHRAGVAFEGYRAKMGEPIAAAHPPAK